MVSDESLCWPQTRASAGVRDSWPGRGLPVSPVIVPMSPFSGGEHAG